MSNNTDAFVSHNIINSPNINGYCFVYKFIDDRIFKWGLSVCDKSNQYEKKLARTLAFQHMQKNVDGFSGFADIGEATLEFIKHFGRTNHGIWSNTPLIPEAVHASIIAVVNRRTYPVRNMTLIVRNWIVMHTTSKGMRSEFNFMFN